MSIIKLKMKQIDNKTNKQTNTNNDDNQHVNSNFRAFWLAAVTRNSLGYLLFCDRSQDGVSLRDIFERRNWATNEVIVIRNKYHESD